MSKTDLPPERKFAGVAYWSLGEATAGWVDEALAGLRPLCERGGATAQAELLPEGGTELRLTLGEGHFVMRVKHGEGRGVVPASPAAIAIVLCLMAMRRRLPNLFLVDDEQVELPVRVSDTYPLFKAEWEHTQAVAETLGLMPSPHFLDHDGAITRLMF